VWAPMPILERPFVGLIAQMVPGTWYSRADLRSFAPDAASNWVYGRGKPYLDRGQIPAQHPSGFLALFRLNPEGEALRAAFLAAQAG
jgi:hypothetical protein